MKESFKKQWEDYKKVNFSTTALSGFPYQKNKAESLRLAICFWMFVKQTLNWSDYTESKREFLLDYVDNQNTFIALIAKIELLPDRIWRKVLWRYNIDFLSLESFLRRVTEDQINGINENYEDIYVHNIAPRVLKMTVRDRFMSVIYMMVVYLGLSKYIGLPDDGITNKSGTRYLSKGAWAFNLANLDFGFSMYPDGIETDRKVENRSAAHFLSVKNHINDFIVNQDDGIYWFFYRFSRAGILIFKDSSKVKLSPWICPGFWKTLLLNAWFFLSPFTLVFWAQIDHLSIIGKILCALTGFPLIIWSVFWLLIIGIISIFTVIDKFSFQIKRFLRPLQVIIVLLIACFIGGLAILGVLYLFDFLVSIYKSIGLPKYLFAVISVTITMYIIGVVIHQMVHNEFFNGSDKEEIDHVMVKNSWAFKSVVAYVIGWLILLAFWQKNLVFIGLVVAWIYISAFGTYIVANSLLFISIAVISILAVILLRGILISFADEEKFLLYRKKMLIALVLTGITTGFFIIQKLFILHDITTVGLLDYLMIGLAAAMLQGIYLMAVLTEESVMERAKLRDFLNTNSWEFDWDQIAKEERKKYMAMFRLSIGKNNFLTSENIDDVLTDLLQIARTLFDLDRRLDFLEMSLFQVNETTLKRLKVWVLHHKGVIKKLVTNEGRMKCCELILNGSRLNDAMIEAKNFEKEFLQTIEGEKIEKTNIILVVLGKIFNPIGNLMAAFFNFFIDLYRFGTHMMEKSCPYVQESKKL